MWKGKTLYLVEITMTAQVYLLAESEAEAERKANIYSGIHEVTEIDANEIEWPEELDSEDDLDEIPFGDNPRRLTIRQLFALRDEEEDTEPDEERGPVYWCADCLHERVQFDWRNETQLCPACRKVREEEAER